MCGFVLAVYQRRAFFSRGDNSTCGIFIKSLGGTVLEVPNSSSSSIWKKNIQNIVYIKTIDKKKPLCNMILVLNIGNLCHVVV